MIPLLTDVINSLNIFYEKIKITYEVEHNDKLSFLNVLLVRSNRKVKATVFGKETNNDIYLHRRSFAPIMCKKMH